MNGSGGGKFSLFNVETGLFPTGNRRATWSAPSQSRSESVIAINPLDEANLVGASKKFIDPARYHFILGPIHTDDAGINWHESTLPLQPGWDGMTDPTVAFDDLGHAFLVGEPVRFNPPGAAEDLHTLGMVAYRSTDGGATWGPATMLDPDSRDDKQWVLCDTSPASPHRGNVYAAWGANAPLKFARSTDGGASWRGRGAEAPGSALSQSCYAPDITLSPDGTLHILWHQRGGSTISYVRSTDGGDSFGPVQTVVTGLTGLDATLDHIDGWPHFDHATFRVLTIATSCAGADGSVVVAWADTREGGSRIYFRRSPDGGLTWSGPASGQPLLPNVTFGATHAFHPQVVTTRTGVVGCAFYTFGPQPGGHLIEVKLAGSWDDGVTFPQFTTVSERPWDPAVNAPAVHGNPAVGFIGEYFGLDAGEEDFALLWTDTHTGVQELMSDVVRTKRVTAPRIPELVGQILVGIAGDGGGLFVVGGKLIRIGPRSPLLPALEELARRAATEER